MERAIKTQRIRDLQGFLQKCAISHKELAKETGLKYNSMVQGLSSMHLSEERLNTLEDAALRLADEKARQRGRLMEQFKGTVEASAGVSQ